MARFRYITIGDAVHLEIRTETPRERRELGLLVRDVENKDYYMALENIPGKQHRVLIRLEKFSDMKGLK